MQAAPNLVDVASDSRFAASAPVLVTERLSKRYPGTVALRSLDFALRRGEVRALLGKNGAGKSTFVEMLSGTLQPDAGTIQVDGRPVVLTSPVAALGAGIATVHQEFNLFADLSVAENITIGRFSKFGVVSREQAAREAAAALERLGVSIPLGARLGSLSPRDRQLASIARAVSFDPRVLILDEPTSALSATEIDHLLSLVLRLASAGVAIIYVSHRLDEIPRIADSVTVLRDGDHVATVAISDAPPARIVEMMLGRALTEAPRVARAPVGDVLLNVRGLTSPGRFADISFDVRAGEVVGLWGIPGSGRSELVRAVYGLDPDARGSVEVGGRAVGHRSPRDMIRRGVGLSPDDRKRNGVVLELSVAENLTMACYDRTTKHGVVSRSKVAAIAQGQISGLAIKVSSATALVKELSGGNQQKVVVGKWLAAGVRVLLLDEPTKGIDVEAKAALYRLLRQLTQSGVGVVLAPTELEEVFLACDRVLVLRRGRLTFEASTDTVDAATLMTKAMGA